MLFMYIHTHTPEACLVDQPKELMRLFSEVREGFQKEHVNVVSAHSAAHEHTFYWLLESDDMAALESALRPMTKIGTAYLMPVRKQDYMLS